MNKNMLASKMKLYGDTISSLAEHIGIARATLSNKINCTNGAEFTQNEIAMVKEKYNLTPNEVNEIFFA